MGVILSIFRNLQFPASSYSCSKVQGIYCNKNQPSITFSKFTIETPRTRCETSSKLTKKTPKRRHWRRSGVFIVNFEHISHHVLVILLLTLSR